MLGVKSPLNPFQQAEGRFLPSSLPLARQHRAAALNKRISPSVRAGKPALDSCDCNGCRRHKCRPVGWGQPWVAVPWHRGWVAILVHGAARSEADAIPSPSPFLGWMPCGSGQWNLWLFPAPPRGADVLALNLPCLQSPVCPPPLASWPDPAWKWVLAAATRNAAVTCRIASRPPRYYFFFFLRSTWMNNVVYFYHSLRLGENHSCDVEMNSGPLISCY